MPTKKYISTTEAAKKLGVSRITVFNMIQDGRIKGVKVGRNYIIPANFQEAFIKPYKRKIIPLLKKHGVKKASVFGSTARGQRNKKSDLDLLIELKKPSDLLDWVRLKQVLEENLGMKVDLVSYRNIHPRLKKNILNEQVPIL